MEYQLNSENFSLNIVNKVFEKDINFPVNTIMEVAVFSDGLSINAVMEIDVKKFAKFALDLTHIYETLSGETKIQEPYGSQYISFVGNGKGHILVEGFLHKVNSLGNELSLKFKNATDQTCLKDFSYALLNDYKKYL